MRRTSGPASRRMFPEAESKFRARGRRVRKRLEAWLFSEKPNSRFNSIQDGSGDQTDDKQRGYEQNNSPTDIHRHVFDRLPASLSFSHKDRAVSTQHVDRGYHNAPEGDRTDDLEFIERGAGCSILERPEENEKLRSEIGKSGKPDRGERRHAENKTESWHTRSEPA